MAARRTNNNGRVTPKKAPSRLRLVKVLVQPILVLDDGESLREVVGDTISVVGAEWHEWAESAFTDEVLATLVHQVQVPELVPFPTPVPE